MKVSGDEKEKLMESMGKLNIEGTSTNFKKKPVIIIVVGMAGILGKQNPVLLCWNDSSCYVC